MPVSAPATFFIFFSAPSTSASSMSAFTLEDKVAIVFACVFVVVVVVGCGLSQLGYLVLVTIFGNLVLVVAVAVFALALLFKVELGYVSVTEVVGGGGGYSVSRQDFVIML